jgi:hypothetical protein
LARAEKQTRALNNAKAEAALHHCAFTAAMASFSQQDEAIDRCMDATDSFLEQHRQMCDRLKDVRLPPPFSTSFTTKSPSRPYF